MIKMINYIFWVKQVKSLEFRCKRPTVLFEKFCMGVKDPRCIRKVLCGCKRLAA